MTLLSANTVIVKVPNTVFVPAQYEVAETQVCSMVGGPGPGDDEGDCFRWVTIIISWLNPETLQPSGRPSTEIERFLPCVVAPAGVLLSYQFDPPGLVGEIT